MSWSRKRPIKASIVIGNPHRIIAIQAKSKLLNMIFRRLRRTLIPESKSSAMSFFVPPFSSRLSILSQSCFMNASLADIVPMGVVVSTRESILTGVYDCQENAMLDCNVKEVWR